MKKRTVKIPVDLDDIDSVRDAIIRIDKILKSLKKYWFYMERK